jgi:hypothetical protein
MNWKTSWQMAPGAQAVAMALAGMLAAAPAQADTQAEKREKELLRRLAKSDEQTAALQQRIERLEARVQALRTSLATTGQQPAARSMAIVAPAAAVMPAPAAAMPPVAQASPPPSPPGGSGNPRRAPGAFTVDEEAAQRALERTLTQTGALLLPARTLELTPSFSYRRFEQTSQALVTATIPATGASVPVLANQQNRRNEFTGSLELRAGLPYNAQLEVGLPYNRVTTSLTGGGADTSASGSGIGDVTLGVAKTLTRESGWKPDLIGRLTYNVGNGKRENSGVLMPGGFRQFQAELVALKRQDPLAFVGSVFYGKTFEEDGIRPGDAMGLSLSALLAASPSTSLQFGFSQIHRDKQELNGIRLPGSEQTYGIVTLGASSVISRDATLVTQFGIGLGSDAPKYSLTVSVPLLFR